MDRNLVLMAIFMVVIVISAVTLFLWLYRASNTPQMEKGVLEGEVRIGPICPVEKEGQLCPTPPEVYEARKIIVNDDDGNWITTVDIVPISREDGRGKYRVELEAGTYLVDINRIGIDSSGDVPTQVEIRSGETTTLNIGIDTGIR